MKAAAALAMLAALSGQADAAGCTLGAATYRPAEGETAALRFAPISRASAESPFGFAMSLGSGAQYRFRLAAATGTGESYAELVLDQRRASKTPTTPGGRIGARSEAEAQDDDAPASPIHFFDERFRRAEPAGLDAPAPAAVFLPELQRAFAYWSGNPDPELTPTGGMWLRDCGR
ncbi:hypothetical protein ACFSCV_13810 [Methylopila henanensis]|uniref:Uncharacterized protein n=1 Tax=Methylopila henanensis TaxID=873516 RepID=A0ABW4K7A6_9HYPH